MANYRYSTTSDAMTKIRKMYALLHELGTEKDRISKRYSPDVAKPMLDKINAQYREANQAARDAVNAAIKAAHARVDNARSEMLHMGNAEEDFKLLSLPITFSRDELREMVKRNEGNVLFGRAVAEYAKDHKYEDPDICALANPLPFDKQHHDIDAAGQQLMKYCEEDRLDVARSDVWRERAFSKVDEMGLYANL